MSEMIERVAEILRQYIPFDGISDDCPDAAREVIEAMREPSREILSDLDAFDHVEYIWGRMIDAALGQIDA